MKNKHFYRAIYRQTADSGARLLGIGETLGDAYMDAEDSLQADDAPLDRLQRGRPSTSGQDGDFWTLMTPGYAKALLALPGGYKAPLSLAWLGGGGHGWALTTPRPYSG